jgi:cell division protein FtsL
MADVKKESTEKVEKANTGKEEVKKKGFGAKFMNFLMMGGFIVILIGIVAIVVIVEMLFKK